MKKCDWCLGLEIYENYHDEEWGNEIHDDRMLFEMINLEGAQAGLSWITVLRKRENYRKLFANFEAKKLIKFSDKKIEKILQNPGIIRNKLKVNGVIKNAKAYLKVKEEFESFDKYIWQFVDYKPIINNYKTMSEVPSKTEISDIMSKDMKKRGFTFIGSTICYAFMQACGMVNDHLTYCFKHPKNLK